MSPCKTHIYKEERGAGNDGAAIKKKVTISERRTRKFPNESLVDLR